MQYLARDHPTGITARSRTVREQGRTRRKIGENLLYRVKAAAFGRLRDVRLLGAAAWGRSRPAPPALLHYGAT
ncbi:hypothetical protein ACIBG8_20000 [Nonomuraea sp. NPDC050556]|uniref:hypothetical protein n=1 Tax=Nonomuraea sp. NPDC050556 TaxID=3364369 RepID=UPI0037B20649